MVTEVLDPKLSRRSAVASFFSSDGYKIFKEELDQIMQGQACQLNDLISSKVDDKKLSELNFKLGEREGFKRISYILDSMREELEDEITKIPVSKGQRK